MSRELTSLILTGFSPYLTSLRPLIRVCLFHLLAWSVYLLLSVWSSYLSCVSCLSVCYACCLECVCLLLSVFFVCLPGVSVWSFLFLPHGKHKRSLCSLIFRLGKDEIETTNNYRSQNRNKQHPQNENSRIKLQGPLKQ